MLKVKLTKTNLRKEKRTYLNNKIKYMKKELIYWRQANQLGLFFIALFVICFLWFYARSVEKELHVQLFRLAFLGFSGMNFLGFILGAIQSYVWGYIFVGIWRTVSKIGGFQK